MGFDTARTLGGTLSPALGVFNAISEGEYQAKIAEMNAKIAKENANRSLERTDIEAEDNDRLTAELLGEQEAAQGASGLSITGKSAAAVRARTRILGRRDSLNIRQGGKIEAYNYRLQGKGFKAGAHAARVQAGLDAGSVITNTAASIVGAAKPTAR